MEQTSPGSGVPGNSEEPLEQSRSVDPGLLDEPPVAPEDKSLHDVLMAVLDGLSRCRVRGI